MLRVGLIGAGNISRAHLFGYNRNSEVEVVAMSDINEELAKQRAETFGVKTVYTDYHDILNDKSIDAVSILTPVFTHKNVVIEALRAGKHVLCEKPPCLSAAEAQECVDVAKEEGKLLMWAFVWLFSKEFNYIKEYIDAGHAGEIYHAEIVSTDPCSTLRSWFVNKELSGGGALIDSTIHLLYPVMHLMGYPIMFDQQINHFVDCCLGKAECIVKPEHGVKLMQIIDAVYKSAETGKAVEF